MSAETRLLWTKRREEMLLQAEQCFKSALDKEDGDSWLHYYMLGKIAEKLNKPLGVCLEQFQQVYLLYRFYTKTSTITLMLCKHLDNVFTFWKLKDISASQLI